MAGKETKPSINDENSGGTVSIGALAFLFQCDEKTIHGLTRRGIVVKASHGRYIWSKSVQNYIVHLRDLAAGRGGEEQQLVLTQERARFAREQTEHIALKNATLRGSLLEASAVERKWTSVMVAIRSFMLALSGEIAHKLPHLTRVDIETIDRCIRDALTEAANEIGGDN